MQPSAPEAIDDEDFVYRYRVHLPRPPIPSSSPGQIVLPKTCQSNLIIDAESSVTSPSNPPASDGDKQELEIRRLQDHASSSEAVEDLATSGESRIPILHSNPSYEAHSPPPTIRVGSEGEDLPLYRK